MATWGGTVLGQVVGAVVPMVRLPVTLLQGIESVIAQLTHVAARAEVVVDQVEGLPARVSAVLDRADGLTTQVAGVVDDAATTLAAVQPAAVALAALPAETLAAVLSDLATLLGGARALDPTLLDDATAAARGLPQLLSTVEQRLLPALASLEQLVPVVAQLGVQVDHLDQTVADVGALLGGIPGAARLLKRGETRPARG